MRLLTKSRYRLACECPSKLNYTGNKAYTNAKDDNPFLRALAEGGFQVGALAQCYHPGGVLVETLDGAAALDQTNKLLRQENVVIYEAAFQLGALFIRADIVVKSGSRLDLIEVKSKSFDPRDDKFVKRDGTPSAKWEITLQDLAFQTYVIGQSRADLVVTPYLMLVDTSKAAPVEALNQFFLLKNEDGRPKVIMEEPLPNEVLLAPILTKFEMALTVNGLMNASYDGISFSERIDEWAQAYASGRPIVTQIGPFCGKCEYRADPTERAAGSRSGFHECWTRSTGLSEAELDEPLSLDIWNLRKPKDDLLKAGKYLIREVPEAAIPESQKQPESGWSVAQRQRLQIESVHQASTTPVVDRNGLRSAFAKWKYPLHFIDFETTCVAIPFYRGMAPYGQIAFQFSHHIVHSDGAVVHGGEWISLERGRFPNFDFVRALKAQLLADDGTILRFATHEKTILNTIRSQILQSQEPDRDDLADWIVGLLSGEDHGQGDGRMIDLRETLLRHYYHPRAGGSNSLKAILPAILSTSEFLRQKYSQPIYGTVACPSHNYADYSWVHLDAQGQVTDPYRLLAPIAPDVPDGIERLFEDETISEGGAAMIAYAKSQFTRMQPEEVEALRKGLLQYCELDTLAMVMLWEEWQAQLVDPAPAS